MEIRSADDIKDFGFVPAWQQALLAANPSYVYWGPEEDYMIKRGEGWDSPLFVDSWDTMSLELDDLNEVVNFYFFIHRPHETCRVCDGSGYHPLAHEVINTFYPHQCEERGLPRHHAWYDNITEVELDALKLEGRVPQEATLDEVNRAQRTRCSNLRPYLHHDGINRYILFKARLGRLSLPVDCDVCDGRGWTFTSDETTLGLVLWVLHPRKGASRDMKILQIREEQVPAVLDFLRRAAARNAERFSGVML